MRATCNKCFRKPYIEHHKDTLASSSSRTNRFPNGCYICLEDEDYDPLLHEYVQNLNIKK